jgi:hypothetical protein
MWIFVNQSQGTIIIRPQAMRPLVQTIGSREGARPRAAGREGRGPWVLGTSTNVAREFSF